MSDVFRIHRALMMGYNRRTVQPGMAMTVKEMGPVRASSLALISSGSRSMGGVAE
jgi:hypothetical protein